MNSPLSLSIDTKSVELLGETLFFTVLNVNFNVKLSGDLYFVEDQWNDLCIGALYIV